MLLLGNSQQAKAQEWAAGKIKWSLRFMPHNLLQAYSPFSLRQGTQILNYELNRFGRANHLHGLTVTWNKRRPQDLVTMH